MHRIIIIIVFLNCLFLTVVGQKKDSSFSKKLIFGTSLTYIWDPKSAGVLGDHLYEEYTWKKNIAFQWNFHWQTGISYLNIFTRSKETGNMHYSIGGIFQQYLFSISRRSNLFAEAGLFRGNYCTCGDFDPYKKKTLSYWDVGAGINVRLSEHLKLDIAWQNYQIFNHIPGKYSYTQYVIGLDYKVFSFN